MNVRALKSFLIKPINKSFFNKPIHKPCDLEPLKLCFVTNMNNESFDSYKNIILDAVKGGVTSVQLREKKLSDAKFYEVALQLKELLLPYGVTLIVNDRVKIAKKIGADGVHIGQRDLQPDVARAILGPEKIIGLSIESLEQLAIANKLTSINYVAASAVFKSATVTTCNTYWGLAGLKLISESTTFPVMAIGGINPENIGDIIENGACGAAVIGALHTKNPEKSAADLIAKIQSSLEKKGRVCFRK